MKRHTVFSILFICSLLMTLYFLGATITGNITKTMYCDNGKCYSLCNFNSECNYEEVCCDNDGFGICRMDCESEYEMEPPLTDEVGLEKITFSGKSPVQESPGRVIGDNVIVLLFITLLILLVAIVYYMHHPHKS